MYWKSPFFPPQKCLLLSLPPPLLTSARSCCDKPETNSTGNTNCWNYWSRTIKACISVDEKSPSRRKFRKMESLGKKMAKRKSKNRLGCDSFLGKKQRLLPAGCTRNVVNTLRERLLWWIQIKTGSLRESKGEDLFVWRDGNTALETHLERLLKKKTTYTYLYLVSLNIYACYV